MKDLRSSNKLDVRCSNPLFCGLLLCLFAGIVLTLAIPVNPVFPPKHHIKITPVASNKGQSSDSIVKVKSIVTDAIVYDNTNLSRLCATERGLDVNNLILDKYHTESLICEIFSEGEIRVRLEIANWSGKVTLVLDKKTTVESDFSFKVHGAREVVFSTRANKRLILLNWVLKVVIGALIGLGLFFSSSYLIKRKTERPIGMHGKYVNWLQFTLPIVIGWAFYLFAFWPAITSPDTHEQWAQVLSWHFSDWHPVFHTLTIWLITRLWLSPTIVAVVQILVMGSLIGLILTRHYQHGMPNWLVWVILGMLILPPFGIFIVTIWKDIAYSISILGFTYCVLIIVETHGDWLRKQFAWPMLGILGSFVALYRHNGTPVTFGSMVVLLIAYHKYWKRILAAFILSVIIWIGVKGPLYQFLDVNSASRNPGLGLAFTHLIARHTQTGTEILPNERNFMATIRDDEGRWPYNCYWNQELLMNKTNLQAIRDKTNELGYLALSLSLRRPITTLKHLACNSAFVFRITHPPNFRDEWLYETVYLAISPDYRNFLDYLSPETLMPGLRDNLYIWTNQTYYSRLSWFFWRAPFWMYLLLYSIVIAVIRSKNPGYFLVIIPVLLSSLPLAFFTFVQTYRFVFPVIIVSLLFSGYLLTGIERRIDPVPSSETICSTCSE